MEKSEPYRLNEVPVAPAAFDRERVFVAAPESELSARRIRLHLLLFLATAVTTMFTGATQRVHVAGDSLFDALVRPSLAVVHETWAGNFYPLTQGMIFTATLLTILAAHEFGHYFACRHYGIRATLPFFLPAPPFLLLGTFGAVIKIKAPITTRRALFDIGIAGPLAGFAVAVPASIIGLAIAQPAPPPEGPTAGILEFLDPPLFRIIASALGSPPMIDWNPFYWAAWGTLLVTALNLFPVGQLDGGHVLYAVFGRRIHKWVSVAVVAVTASLTAFTLLVRQEMPVYGLWTLILLFMLKVGHPPVMEDEPLGSRRIILAIVALIVFVLCFMPFPVRTL